MLEINLNPEIEGVLETYAQKDGISKSALALKAISEYLEDREDYDVAVEAARLTGPGPHISLEELIHQHGLEDQLREDSGEAIRQAQSRDPSSDHEVPVPASRRSA